MPLVVSLNYRVLILALLLVPVLIGLGRWQLQRAAEKESILSRYAQRQTQMPVSFADINQSDDLDYLPVTLVGRYDPDRYFLLDNKIQGGQVGYDVLTPFYTEAGTWVIVNRGWVKAPLRRSELPKVNPLPEQTLELHAEIYVPPGEGYQLSGLETGQSLWPKIVTVFDSEFMATQLKTPLFPYQLRLRADDPGALLTDWPTINVSPAKHRAYAVQWFAMALALVIWLLVASVRKRPE